MKNFRNILIILAIIPCLLVTAFAAEDTKPYSIYDNPAFFDQSEYKEVMIAVNDAIADIKQGENTARGADIISNSAYTSNTDGYKVYSLIEPDFVAALKEGYSLSEIISDDYIWVVPMENNEVMSVGEVDGAWSMLGYSIPRSLTAETDIVQVDVIDVAITDLVSEQSVQLQQADDAVVADEIAVQCFESAMYHTTFMYISSGNEEILIPFGSRPDLTGLSNGKPYSIAEVCNILTSTFSTNSNGNGGFGGSISYGGETTAVLAGIIAVMAVVAIVVVKRRKAS